MGNGHAGGPGEGTSGLRTTLHGNAEDLRSYEAAVNARNSAMKLNLVPKRRGTRPSMSASPPVPPSSAGSYINGPGMNANVVPGFDFNNMSRPSSSSSTTSSLANAFGSSAMRHPHPHHPHAGPQMGAQVSAPPMHASSSLPPPAVLHTHMDGSRESSVVSEEGAASSDGDMMRPSFKRLPSQTLGPANSKRALLARGVEGGDGMGMEGMKHGDTLGVPTTNGNINGVGMGGEIGPVGTRPMVGLPERHRRASEANAKV
ncbi:hypothetical protein SERLA73DRAFT_182398 [Serpula lacrymans var. lacrymans S7.3]|uniref:Uncharacterized protein n=1 Tax=Serpula lacrymans var. lacrymans (strain S7.3) TaxID=936435 RepID=F8PX48_SERL3|nr:hypothetical protein SERLA73DRAFT_182398 [Serpula lacrymans var. lacrymans S7.3]